MLSKGSVTEGSDHITMHKRTGQQIQDHANNKTNIIRKLLLKQNVLQSVRGRGTMSFMFTSFDFYARLIMLRLIGGIITLKKNIYLTKL